MSWLTNLLTCRNRIYQPPVLILHHMQSLWHNYTSSRQGQLRCSVLVTWCPQKTDESFNLWREPMSPKSGGTWRFCRPEWPGGCCCCSGGALAPAQRSGLIRSSTSRAWWYTLPSSPITPRHWACALTIPVSQASNARSIRFLHVCKHQCNIATTLVYGN